MLCGIGRRHCCDQRRAGNESFGAFVQRYARRVTAANFAKPMSDQRRIDSGSHETARRLARLLVELADEHGRPTLDGVDIDILLTQQELASLIAASRESIVRSLRSLRGVASSLPVAVESPSAILVDCGRRRTVS
jgi:histone H3/H4